MKVYLWAHIKGVFLVNEDYTMVAKPYFITHPHRTVLLKERFVKGMSKEELLSTISDDVLQTLVNDSVVNWKTIIPYINGFEEDFIAVAEI